MSNHKWLRRLAILLGVLLAAGSASWLGIQRLGERRLAAAIERFEAEIGSLDAAAHAPPELAEAENAAYWLQRGFAALALSDSEGEVVNAYWTDRSAGLSADLEEILHGKQPALDHLRHAAGLPDSAWGNTYSPRPSEPVMPIDSLWGAKILTVDAHAALAAGDRARVLADLKALAALHRALANEPLVIFQLLAASIGLGLSNLVHDLLPSDLADGALLEEAAALLAAGDAGDRVRTSFAVEASWLLTMFEQPAGGEAGFRSRLSRLAQPLWTPFEIAAGIDLYHRLGKATDLPATRIDAALQPESSTTPIIGVVAQALVPNLAELVKKQRAGAAARRLTRIAVDLRLHALRHGAYPADLDDLPLALLPDPYADGPLRFEHHADGSASLSYPQAEALWREVYRHTPVFRPSFAWQLPS